MYKLSCRRSKFTPTSSHVLLAARTCRDTACLEDMFKDQLHYSCNSWYRIIYYNYPFQHPLLSSRLTFLPCQGILIHYFSYPNFATGVVFHFHVFSMLFYWEGALEKDGKKSQLLHIQFCWLISNPNQSNVLYQVKTMNVNKPLRQFSSHWVRMMREREMYK